MASEKKIEFLIKQGFDRDVVNVFVNSGVDKNLLWFLGAHKKGMIKYLNSEEIKLVNKFLESAKKDISRLSYQEILERAHFYEQNEQRKINNIIYTLSNGYYVSVLNSQDLVEEGVVMANCVGTYESRVGYGYVGLLAIKQPSGKTVAHIEILKNGLIGQNYAKANNQLSKENWLMVLEFFENNSKKVDLSKLFGESYVVVNNNCYINEISLSIPTSVNVVLKDGVKKLNQTDGFEVKRFMSFNKRGENASKINSKSDVINWIEEKKQEVLKAYDDLISQVVATSASNLYLSDEIKEKIFGSGKGAYLLKGDDYNISELDPRYGQETEKMAEAGIEDNYENGPVPVEMEDPRPARPIRRRARPLVRVAVAHRPVGDLEAPEEARAPEDAYDVNAGEEAGYHDDVDEPQAERGVVLNVNERVLLNAEIDRVRGEAIVLEAENVEIAENQENIALVEDNDGNYYEVNVNDIEEADMPDAEAGEDVNIEVGFMPRDFDQILRKAT
jgi:hypothetical protein